MRTNITPSTHDGEIDGSISLFAETVEFCRAFYAEITRYRTTAVDGDDLANKGEKYNVVCNEDQIQIALSVTNARVRGGDDGVRNEKKGVEGVWEAPGDEWGERLPVDIKNNGYQEKLG